MTLDKGTDAAGLEGGTELHLPDAALAGTPLCSGQRASSFTGGICEER